MAGKKKPTISIYVTLKEKGAVEALKRLNTEILDFGKRVHPAMVVVGTAVDKVGEAVSGVAAIVGVATAAMTAATTSAIQFDTALRSVTTIADTATLPIGEIRDLSYDLARLYGSNVTDNARNLYEVISAGVSDAATAQAVLRQANELSIGGLASMESAVSGLTSVINAYGASNVSAVRAANALTVAAADGSTRIEDLAQSLGLVTPIASSVGISIEEVASAVSVLTANGVPTATAVEYVRSALANIIKPSKQAIGVARELGVEFNAQALASKGLSQFLEDVVLKSGATHNQVAKLIGDIGGFNAVTVLTKDGLVKFNESLRHQADNAGRAHKAFVTMSDSLGHQVKIYDSLTDAASTAFGELVSSSELVRGALAVVNDGLSSVVDVLRSDAGRQAAEDLFGALLSVLSAVNTAFIVLLDSLDELHLFLRVLELPLDAFYSRWGRIAETYENLGSLITEDRPESPLVLRLTELNAELDRLSEHRSRAAQAPFKAEDLGLGAGFGYEPRFPPAKIGGGSDPTPRGKKETAAQRKAREERERARRQDAEGLAPAVGSISGEGDARTAGLQGAIDLEAYNASVEIYREYRAQLIEIDTNYVAGLIDTGNVAAQERQRGREAIAGYIEDLGAGLEGFVDLLSGETTAGAAEALQGLGDMVAGAFVNMVAGVASGSQGVLEAIGGFVGTIITQLGMMLIQLGTAGLLASALAAIPFFAPLVGGGAGVGPSLAAIAGGAALVAIGTALGGAASGGGSTPAVAGRATSRGEAHGKKVREAPAFNDAGPTGVPSRGLDSGGGQRTQIVYESHVHFDRGMVVAGSPAEAGRQIEAWSDASARLRGQRNPWGRAA